MADTQALTRPASAWTSFANTTTTVPVSSTVLSTASDASSIPSITFLSTLSTTFPRPASSSWAVSTLDVSTTSSSGIPTVAISSLFTTPPLTESVPGPPFVPVPLSSSSLPASSITSATISNTSISQPTSNLPSSPSPATSPTTTLYPTPVDVSSPLTSLPRFNPNNPTPNPTSESPAPPGGSHRTPPILMIIAIVISVFVFILLVTLLVLRQLGLRQHAAQRFRNTSLPPTGDNGSSHSTVSTYHGAHRGEVRVVIERRPGMSRLWPVPPGHPSHYSTEPGMPVAAEGEESAGAADPNQWSVTSQDGSSSLPETGAGTGAGTGRGRASARAGVGRAY